MTKAAEILHLFDGIRSNKQIANIVGCHPNYIRIVVRQRKGSGESDIDRRYKAAIKPYGDREAARRARREAYAEARAAGQSPQQARKRVGGAYNAELERTGALRRTLGLEVAS